jgi:DnaJ-class molecular chaperone
MDKCTVCNGTGRIERQGRGQLIGERGNETDPCPRCNGLGELEPPGTPDEGALRLMDFVMFGKRP